MKAACSIVGETKNKKRKWSPPNTKRRNSRRLQKRTRAPAVASHLAVHNVLVLRAYARDVLLHLLAPGEVGRVVPGPGSQAGEEEHGRVRAVHGFRGFPREPKKISERRRAASGVATRQEQDIRQGFPNKRRVGKRRRGLAVGLLVQSIGPTASTRVLISRIRQQVHMWAFFLLCMLGAMSPKLAGRRR